MIELFEKEKKMKCEKFLTCEVAGIPCLECVNFKSYEKGPTGIQDLYDPNVKYIFTSDEEKKQELQQSKNQLIQLNNELALAKSELILRNNELTTATLELTNKMNELAQSKSDLILQNLKLETQVTNNQKVIKRLQKVADNYYQLYDKLLIKIHDTHYQIRKANFFSRLLYLFTSRLILDEKHKLTTTNND